MYTYLATDGKKYKIGKSKNPIKRVSGMKTSNPDIILLGYVEQDLEKELHNKYKDKHIVREWYNLNELDLKQLFEFFEKYTPKEVKRGRKAKHRIKDIKFRILQIVSAINEASEKENRINIIKEDIAIRGFYKIEVLKDCHFIVYASSLFKAIEYLNKMRIFTTRLISYKLVNLKEEASTVNYLYKKDEFVHCYLKDIDIPLEEGVICDDFIDYGYDTSKILLEEFINNC